MTDTMCLAFDGQDEPACSSAATYATCSISAAYCIDAANMKRSKRNHKISWSIVKHDVSIAVLKANALLHIISTIRTYSSPASTLRCIQFCWSSVWLVCWCLISSVGWILFRSFWLWSCQMVYKIFHIAMVCAVWLVWWVLYPILSHTEYISLIFSLCLSYTFPLCLSLSLPRACCKTHSPRVNCEMAARIFQIPPFHSIILSSTSIIAARQYRIVVFQSLIRRPICLRK